MKRVLVIIFCLFCFITGYAGTVTFNVDSIATANSWTAKTAIPTYSFSIAPINFTFVKGSSNCAYYSPEIRCYYGSTLTISSTYIITNITFTYSVSNSGVLTADVGTLSNKVWTGNATSIVFTAGGGSSGKTNGQVRYSNIVVTYIDGGSDPTPTVLPVYKDTTTLANVCDTIDGRTAGTYILLKDTTITSTDTTIHYTKQVVEECIADDPTPTPSVGCTESIDFEDKLTTYTTWSFTNFKGQSTNSAITPHSSSYYAATAGTATAYMITSNAITNLQSITFYVTKQTTNTSASYWEVYVSNGSTSSVPTNWTKVTSVSASSMSKNTWVEVTADLSAYANSANKVAIYYTGSTAVRCIDDVCLSYKTDPTLVVNSISVINTVNGLMSDGKTGTVNPLFYEGTSTLSATSDNSKFTVTCEDLNYTVKYKASNSCLDTATLTFTYDTLTASVKVYGSNIYKVTNITDTATDTQVTIKWTKSQTVSSYKVVFNGVEHIVTKGTYTETGLTANTAYTYTITPIVDGVTCIEEYSGSITTQSCMKYPSDISYSSETNSISLFWTLTDNCNVYLFKNSTCTDTLQHIDNVNNTCTFTNLEENTKYYVIAYGGGTCPSNVIEVATESPYITIVDWYPDSIHVDLNSADAATVMLEKEVKQTTGVVHYAKDLFFSKYYEAKSNTKLLGIYNGTASTISLKGVRVIGAKDKEWSKVTAQDIINLDTIGEIPSQTEIILYSIGNSKYDLQIYNCVKDGISWDDDNWYPVGTTTVNQMNDGHTNMFGSAQVSTAGEKTYALQRAVNDSTWKFIDIIGAGDTIAATSSNAKKQTSIRVTVEVDGKDTTLAMNDDYGWYCADGTNYATKESIPLSTNRYLLIRKNTVEDGFNALKKDTTDFVTLCEEWEGVPVGVHSKDSLDAVRSCDYFQYVASFDYNGYYISYDSVSTTPLNTTHRNADGTYTIPIPELDTLSCNNIKVISKDDAGNELASHSSRVPIMVTTDMNVNNVLFTQFTIDTCKICDIVIRDNATLSTVSNPQRPKFRNVYVYSGSTLNVPANTQHSINSLILRSDGDEVPYAVINDSLVSYVTKVYFTKRITNDRYYFFALPYDCKVSDIYFASGEKPTYGVDWQILYYDGAQRAADNSSSTSHWNVVSRTSTLKAGTGYAIAVNVKQTGWKKEIVLPMTITNANIYATDTVTKSISITAYGAVNGAYPEFTKDGLHANSVGWNFIGNPYLNTFGQLNSSEATSGKVVLSSDSTWYTFTDETNLYYTIPNAGQDQTYYQDFANSYTLKPFQAMFIQASANGTLIYQQSSVSRAPKRIVSNESSIVRIHLSNAMYDDYTTFLFGDNTDAYEVGKDLIKQLTFYTDAPQVYSLNTTDKLAFNALNDSIAQNIPLGVYLYKGSTNTFRLNKDFNIQGLDHVYLTDHTTNITTDLLYDEYSFTTTSQVYTNTRFTLSIIRKQDLATGTTTESSTYKNGYIYDVTGKYITTFDNINKLSNGMYILYNGTYSKKIIVAK